MNAKRLFVLFVLLAILLPACGGGVRPQTVSVPVTVVVNATSAPAVQTVVVEAYATPMPSPAFVPTAAPVSDSGAPGGASQLSFAPVGSGLVIKDAEMELLVRDTDVALGLVTQMASDSGGYIISAQTWYQDGFKYASLKLGIPSASFEGALNYLRRLAVQVVRENATGQDVSAEYTDLQSKLVNLEATAARVREFLADAKTVEESLRISGQLSELESQIETIKGQMRYYEGRAAFSTVTVYLTPQYPTPTPSMTPTATATPTSTPTATPTATPTSWNPGETFEDASGVLVGMTQTTIDALIWIGVVAGPVGLVLGLLAGIVRLMFRKR